MRFSSLALLALPATALPTFGLFAALTDLMTSSSTLPQSTLPAPDGQKLKYIFLGVGTQNYTCATSLEKDAPVPSAVGALATLYDATASRALPVAGRIVEDTMTCTADKMSSGMGLRAVGKHFFNSAGVPSFDIYGFNDFLSSKKVAADADAAKKSCAGRDGGAPVAWLNLVDRGDGLTRGVKSVYRVNTAGGGAPATCAGLEGSFTRDYAAEYWFYD